MQFSRCIYVKLTHGVAILLALGAFANAAAETPANAAAKPVPHIALLLPLHSPTLGSAANAVQQGILAAAALQKNTLPVRVYSDFDEARSVLAAYQSAIAGGAVAVVGPLTKTGVRQLADEKNIPVPTLALNQLESQTGTQLYCFGMAVDAEARQIARMARKQGLKQAIVISANESFSRRLQFAFEEQWIASGGTISREIDFSNDTSVFANVLAAPDSMVFLATDVEKTRTIRPYLPNSLAVFATSQIFAGNTDTLINFDLDGIRFIDMPWLMQTELPAVAAYPRANLSTDYERLYALGIDAWRLINILIARQTREALPLNGVTGRIQLVDHSFLREALPALFVQGRGQSADAPVAPAVQLFPDQFKNSSAVEAAPAADVPRKL